MDKKIKVKNILCYSRYDFNSIMKNNGWIDEIGPNCAAISICDSDKPDDHWFKTDFYKFGLGFFATNFRVFNLDIDDCSPYWFKNHESECYDKALELYKEGKVEQSNNYFNRLVEFGENNEYCKMLYPMNYRDAEYLVTWIDYVIKKYDTIYVHCTAGASRSQGVVRYIIDTYCNDYIIKLNPDNPNDTYNAHVTMMLKRAFREIYYKNS